MHTCVISGVADSFDLIELAVSWRLQDGEMVYACACVCVCGNIVWQSQKTAVLRVIMFSSTHNYT